MKICLGNNKSKYWAVKFLKAYAEQILVSIAFHAVDPTCGT